MNCHTMMIPYGMRPLRSFWMPLNGWLIKRGETMKKDVLLLLIPINCAIRDKSGLSGCLSPELAYFQEQTAVPAHWLRRFLAAALTCCYNFTQDIPHVRIVTS